MPDIWLKLMTIHQLPKHSNIHIAPGFSFVFWIAGII
jgi:hypothetical protein